MHVTADGVKAFVTDVVLDAAGILAGGLFAYAEIHQKTGECLVALVHTGGDLHALFGKGDEAVLIHHDIAVFTQAFSGIADACLGYADILCYI